MASGEIVEHSAGEPDRVQTPEQILLRETLDGELQQAIDTLPDVFRQAVWLRDVEEFTYAEIAEMLGIASWHRDVAYLSRPADAL